MCIMKLFMIFRLYCDPKPSSRSLIPQSHPNAVQSKVLRFAQPVLIRASLYHCNYPYSGSGRITPPVFHFSAEQASIDF
jgi:hypothetical protein